MQHEAYSIQCYQRKLLTEAVVVGAAAVPAVWLSRRLLRGVQMTDQQRAMWSLAIAGAGLHLAFEWSGANAWYLHQSAAALRFFNAGTISATSCSEGTCLSTPQPLFL